MMADTLCRDKNKTLVSLKISGTGPRKLNIKPLVKELKLVDANVKPTMGHVYDAMDWAKVAMERRSKER